MISDSALDKIGAQRSNTPLSSKPDMRKAQRTEPDADHKPVWADGLKRMYDAVVEEQIPDDLLDLLRKLDDAGGQS